MSSKIRKQDLRPGDAVQVLVGLRWKAATVVSAKQDDWGVLVTTGGPAFTVGMSEVRRG